MKLEAGCPRCPAPLEPVGSGWRCATHGSVTPLMRAMASGYEAFAEHLMRAQPLPTWLPWPMPPGWQVADFGCVAAEGKDAVASFATCFGPTDDGVVEMTVLTEEPGVGLAARCAGLDHEDPGHEAGTGPPLAKLRVDEASVPMWLVSGNSDSGTLDRMLLVGEAQGRWLWLVLRPASAAFLIPAMSPLVDVSGLGPELVVLPFGSTPRSW